MRYTSSDWAILYLVDSTLAEDPPLMKGGLVSDNNEDDLDATAAMTAPSVSLLRSQFAKPTTRFAVSMMTDLFLCCQCSLCLVPLLFINM
jgi:hypothetical protein